MSSIRKIAQAAAVAALIGTTAAACGSSSKTTSPASAGTTAKTDTVTAIPVVTGDTTTVSLNAQTVQALTSLGVAPSPYGTAKLNGTDISFPITTGYGEIHSDKSFKPGYIVGSLEHDGSGLTLKKGSTVVNLTNFVVDPGNSILYGTVNGKPGVALADLDGTDVQVSTPGGTVHLDGTKVNLTQGAASALDAAFGTTAITPGLNLGVAHIVLSGTANTYTDKTVEVSRLSGTTTSVELNPQLVTALTSLGVKPATVGSATLANGSVTFPITGGVALVHSDHSYQPGYVAGVVLHQGSGLSFTKGSTTVTVTDFVINPANSMLYATVGNTYNFPLFFLDGSPLQISQVNGAYHLDGTKVELTPQAASALNSAFGTTAFQPYFLIGTAHLVLS